MKVAFVLVTFCCLAASSEEFNGEIDWSKVLPVHDLPGFWLNREFKPAFNRHLSSRRRIVGGNEATPHNYKYQVGILMTFGTQTGLCGGSLLSDRAILTAAHCLVGSSQAQMVYGAHNIQVIEPGQYRVIVTPAAYRIHEDFDPSNLNFDVAIVINPTSIWFTPTIEPIALAPPDAGTFTGDIATATGWGRFSDDSMATSPVLRTVDVPVISNEACAAFFGDNFVVESTICTSGAGGRGTCNADSGGPLAYFQAGSPILIGVTAFGPSLCEASHPSGYVRVSTLRPWIDVMMIP